MQLDSAASSRILLLISSEPQRFQDYIAKLEMFGEFRVQQIATWHEAAREMKHDSFDIVMVDYNIYETGGAAVCNFLRRDNSTIPIIVFAEEYSKTELVLCLNSGANDYVTAADDPAVIAARVRAQIRTHLRNGHLRTRVGAFWFILSQRALLDVDNDRTVPLTVRETDLLSYLALHPNKPVGIDDIYRKVWHYRGPVNSHTVQTHVYRLRQKIEREPSNPTVLVFKGSGYCLVVEANADGDFSVDA